MQLKEVKKLKRCMKKHKIKVKNLMIKQQCQLHKEKKKI